MTSFEQPKREFDSVDEELVAYLDGELGSAESADIEKRLTQDASVRERLQHLQRAWDMLDELPQDEIPEQFAQTTIGLVVASTKDEVKHAQSSATAKRGFIWVITLASCTLACVVGYQIMFAMLNSTNRQLEQDLPVIENMDAYRSAESVDFLRRLADEGLFEGVLAVEGERNE